MSVIDPSTGEILPAYLFVCALGRSGYPYAEAFPSKEKENWIAAHRNAFEYYGGVSLILVPDNDKSAVTLADKYDPEINKTYREMAEHYDVAVIPARVRKPKDKPKVEKSVGDLETWVMAALRNITFFSFTELNVAIRKKLAEFSDKPYQKLEGSRRSVFLEQDQPALRCLPGMPYEYADWRLATVNADYHVEVHKQYYSTPYWMRIKNNPKTVTVTFDEIDKILSRASFTRRQPRSGSSRYTYAKNGRILTVPKTKLYVTEIYIKQAIEAIGDCFDEE